MARVCRWTITAEIYDEPPPDGAPAGVAEQMALWALMEFIVECAAEWPDGEALVLGLFGGDEGTDLT